MADELEDRNQLLRSVAVTVSATMGHALASRGITIPEDELRYMGETLDYWLRKAYAQGFEDAP